VTAPPSPKQPKPQRERVGAVGYPNRVARATIGREFLLEGRDIRTEDEARILYDLRDALEDLAAQPSERRGRVE
jgi:hypothetical protein